MITYEIFIKIKVNVKDLLLFYDWLCIGDVDDEVSTFIQRDGMQILSVHLNKSNNEANLDFNKQILILKIMLELFSYDDVREDLHTLQKVINQITANLDLINVEVSGLVLDILTNICWISDQGLKLVLQSFEWVQKLKNFHYPFEPLIRVFD